MHIHKRLTVKLNGESKDILVGSPDNDEEREEMYALRYRVYLRKHYINPNDFTEPLDIDEYDKEGKCDYFIAKVNDQIFGSVRLIEDNPLPVECYFEYEEPSSLKGVEVGERSEISRLVVEPYQINGNFLPRNVVTLLLFSCIIDHAIANGRRIGLAFVKASLSKKLKRLKVPFYYFPHFKQCYPASGVLYKYFNDISDPVIPIYVFVGEINEFLEDILKKSRMFVSNQENVYTLQDGKYTRFLRKVGVL